MPLLNKFLWDYNAGKYDLLNDYVRELWPEFLCRETSLVSKTRRHFTKIRWLWVNLLQNVKNPSKFILEMHNKRDENSRRLHDYIVLKYGDKTLLFRPTSRSSDRAKSAMYFGDQEVATQYDWSEMKKFILQNKSMITKYLDGEI